MINVQLDPRKIIAFILLSIIALAFCNIIFFWLEVIGVGSFRFNSLFYLNEESNIPTYFSGLNLLLASIITYTLSLRRSPYAKASPAFWKLLSIIFLFLSFDEVAMFHERIYRVTVLFTDYFNTPLVWYVPYSLLVAITITSLWQNFTHLDSHTKAYMATSALIFLSGAIGLEHLSNNCDSTLDITCNQLILFGLSSLEETLEMLGVCLFNYAALNLLAEDSEQLIVHISKATT